MSEAQERCLQRWEEQKKQWDQFNAKMGKKVGRKAQETLASTQWRFREKLEDLDVIEASVPQSHRASGSVWEMTLRGGAAGAGGIRYVKVGGTYPYPLYCPIRDRELQPPESNQFMRMVTDDSAQFFDKTKKKLPRLADSDFYQSREKIYKKWIQEKFPHRTFGTCEAFKIIGEAPPLAAEPIPEEDDSGGLGVSFKKPLPSPKKDAEAAAALKREAEQAEALRLQKEAEEAAAAAMVVKEGPDLEISSRHLSFNTEPNAMSHASLVLQNVGTTAVYYEWKLKTTKSIVPHPPPAEEERTFQISTVPDGVILPDEEKTFVFSFRHAKAGVYIEDWELHTTPKVPTSYVVRLRAVVVSRDGNPIARLALEDRLQEHMELANNREIFTNMINVQKDNAFDSSNAQQALNAIREAEQQYQQELQDAENERQRLWAEHNSTFNTFYHPLVYRQFEKLHVNVSRYLHIASRYEVSSYWNQDGLDLAIPPWSGSLAILSEEIQQIDDIEVKREFDWAFLDLVHACTYSHAPDSEIDQLVSRKESCSPILAYATMRDALDGLIGNLVDRSHELQLRYGLIEEPVDPKAGKGGKGGAKGAKAAPKAAAPKPSAKAPGGKNAKGRRSVTAEIAEEDTREKDYHEKFDSESRVLMGGAIDQFCNRLQQIEDRQLSLAELDVRVTHQKKISELENAIKQKKHEEKMNAIAKPPEPEATKTRVPSPSKRKK